MSKSFAATEVAGLIEATAAVTAPATASHLQPQQAEWKQAAHRRQEKQDRRRWPHWLGARELQQAPPEKRHGSTIEYKAMPSLRDVASDGWLRTFIIYSS